ncbi:MAG: glycosyltransferase family 4 protein [Ferruginibacter sp.]
MKILHVLYSGLGGHGNVFFSLVSADEKKVFQYEALFNGIEDVRQDYIDSCSRLNVPLIFVKKKQGSHLGFFVKMVKAIIKSRADIIFLHGSIHAAAARTAVFFMRGKQKIIVRETQANHLKTKREKLALKIAMKLADRIVFLSREYDDEIKSFMPENYRSKKISIIPNGLDLSLYTPGNKSQGNRIILGMQSRLVAIKDHETLLRAIASLKKSRPGILLNLIIAGDGEHKKYLENLQQQLGLQQEVHFCGILNENELIHFLQSLDIYVHASLGETMSTAVMQAMACRLPLIASDVKGINNMVQNGVTGLLVPAKDTHKMAAAIEELISDPQLRNRLSVEAFKYAQENFSSRRMIEDYKKIFAS